MINLNSVDWNSIVNQLIKQQHKSRVEPLQIQQNLSNTVKQSLEELRSKFIGIASSLESFKTANGGFLAKTASSSSSSVVTATVNGFAQVGTYNITVTSLATTGHSTSAAYSSKNTPIFNGLNDTLPASERTISVTIGSGSNAQTFNFVVTSSTTLESLANQINSTIPTDKAVAQIINTGTSDNPAYRLRIQAVQTGVDKGSVAVNYSGSQTQIQDFVSSM
ncbi:MAG: hypothetical protein NZO16_00530, partial [Deltaproteobacteria bacterium]|nr:hypothetical protein [Deltaproteobacteria bacterium]